MIWIKRAEGAGLSRSGCDLGQVAGGVRAGACRRLDRHRGLQDLSKSLRVRAPSTTAPSVDPRLLGAPGGETSTELELDHRTNGLRAFRQRQREYDRDECEHERNGENVLPRLRYEIGGGREEQKECDHDKDVKVAWQA